MIQISGQAQPALESRTAFGCPGHEFYFEGTKMNLRHSAFAILALSLTAMSGAGTTLPEGVDDIESMKRRADGKFEVTCSDGRTEIVDDAKIRADQVCNPLSTGVHISQCNQVKSSQTPTEIQNVASCPLTVTSENQISIVFIVDNSGSMGAHHATYAPLISKFLRGLSAAQISWNAEVISTDTSNAPFVGTSKTPSMKTTPEAIELIVSKLGTSGSGHEQHYGALNSLLTKTPGFLSKGLPIIIVITDEEDQSTQTVDTVTQKFALVAPQGGLAFSFLPTDASNCAPDGPAWKFAGTRHEKFLNTFGGKKFDLCAAPTDIDLAFQTIANEIQVAAPTASTTTVYDLVNTKTIFLPANVNPTSVQVAAGGIRLPKGQQSIGGYWEFDAKQVAIVFHDFAFVTSKPMNFEVTYSTPLTLPSPTPTPTATITPTPTPTATPSPSPTVTVTPSPTPTPTVSPSPTPTAIAACPADFVAQQAQLDQWISKCDAFARVILQGGNPKPGFRCMLPSAQIFDGDQYYADAKKACGIQ